MDEVEILIIGAGVVGLAAAAEVASQENRVVVLEKNKSFGQETSSRNSEVIHGGMYYPSGSLKAKLCLEGRHLLYELCLRQKIPYQKTGKLIVATAQAEAAILERLFLQGKNNGANELKMVNRQELAEMEPHIFGMSALYSPQTGIIDSHRLMQYFLDSAQGNEAMVAYDSEVIGIEKISSGYKVTVKNGNDTLCLKTQVVINCAGLDADTVAQMAGIDIKKSQYELHYCKGQYFRLNYKKAGLMKRLVYPVPQPKSAGLGIHATLDLAAGLRLGPDDEYLKNRIKDYSVDNSKKDDFYSSAKKFLPFLAQDDLFPDICGIRPKLQGPDDAFRDFVIREESAKALPGLINLIGIESPGLTASLAIAKYVKSLIRIK